MSTKAELEDEVTRLRAEVEALRAGGGSAVAPAQPVAPSFGICEGVRADLELNGRTTDPFTGREIVADDEPAESDGDVTTLTGDEN